MSRRKDMLVKGRDMVLIAPKTLVRRTASGCFEFFLDGDMVYDIHPTSAGASLRWIEHLAEKTWITTHHLEQFARLAADSFGGRHG